MVQLKNVLKQLFWFIYHVYSWASYMNIGDEYI